MIKDQKEDLNIKKGLRGHALFRFISSSFIEKLFVITRLFYRLIKTAHIRDPFVAEPRGGRRRGLITWLLVRFPRATCAASPPLAPIHAAFSSKLKILCGGGGGLIFLTEGFNLIVNGGESLRVLEITSSY